MYVLKLGQDAINSWGGLHGSSPQRKNGWSEQRPLPCEFILAAVGLFPHFSNEVRAQPLEPG